MGNCAAAQKSSEESKSPVKLKLALKHGSKRRRDKAARKLLELAGKLDPDNDLDELIEFLCTILRDPSRDRRFKAVHGFRDLFPIITTCKRAVYFCSKMTLAIRDMALSSDSEEVLFALDTLCSLASIPQLVEVVVDCSVSLLNLTLNAIKLENERALSLVCQLLLRLSLESSKEQALHGKGAHQALAQLLASPSARLQPADQASALVALYNVARMWTPSANYISTQRGLVVKLPKLLLKVDEITQYSVLCLLNTVGLDRETAKLLVEPLKTLLCSDMNVGSDYVAVLIRVLQRMSAVLGAKSFDWLEGSMVLQLLSYAAKDESDNFESIVQFLCLITSARKQSCTFVTKPVGEKLLHLLASKRKTGGAAKLLHNFIKTSPETFSDCECISTIIDCLQGCSEEQGRRHLMGSLLQLTDTHESALEVLCKCGGPPILAKILLNILAGPKDYSTTQCGAWIAELLGQVRERPSLSGSAEMALGVLQQGLGMVRRRPQAWGGRVNCRRRLTHYDDSQDDLTPVPFAIYGQLNAEDPAISQSTTKRLNVSDCELLLEWRSENQVPVQSSQGVKQQDSRLLDSYFPSEPVHALRPVKVKGERQSSGSEDSSNLGHAELFMESRRSSPICPLCASAFTPTYETPVAPAEHDSVNGSDSVLQNNKQVSALAAAGLLPLYPTYAALGLDTSSCDGSHSWSAPLTVQSDGGASISQQSVEQLLTELRNKRDKSFLSL